MSIRPQGLDHVVLRITDMERAIRFYCEILGCTEERRVNSLGLVQLRAGQSLVDLVDVAGELGHRGGRAPNADGRNMDHFCLRVEPFDEPDIRSHLLRHGIAAGATVKRYGAEGNGPSIYLEDPDGNVVELKGPPET